MKNSDGVSHKNQGKSATQSNTLEKWRELYESAAEFKKLAPWDWMEDTDLFGIQNPENGEIGYCCVLGACREFFGLAVYLGTEGLNGYLKLQAGKPSTKKDAFMILLTKKCLVASFEDKEDLYPEDLETINELGLVFQGQHAWPQFRNYEPGYFPWFLSEGEVIFLTLCLKQASLIALRFRSNPHMLTAPMRNHNYVRTAMKKNGTIEWTDEWRKPESSREHAHPPMTIDLDSERIRKINTSLSRTEMVWEIDAFYLPECVQENKEGRPFYPVTFICVDQVSDYIWGTRFTSKHREGEEFVKYFLGTVEKNGLLPKKVLIKNKSLLPFIKPLTELFNIELELVKGLKASSKARRSILDHFAREADVSR